MLPGGVLIEALRRSAPPEKCSAEECSAKECSEEKCSVEEGSLEECWALLSTSPKEVLKGTEKC